MASAGFERRPRFVPVDQVQITSLGVRPLDRRRVDVAVDLTPCQRPLTVECVIVGPGDEELASTLMIDTTNWTLDRIVHLRQDAADGEHILHVGVFSDGELVTQAARRFTFSGAVQVVARLDSGD